MPSRASRLLVDEGRSLGLLRRNYADCIEDVRPARWSATNRQMSIVYGTDCSEHRCAQLPKIHSGTRCTSPPSIATVLSLLVDLVFGEPYPTPLLSQTQAQQ